MAQKIVNEAKLFCTEGNEMAALAADVKSNAEDAARTTKDVSELFQTVRDYARQASNTLEGHQSVIIEGIKVAQVSSKSLNTIVSDCFGADFGAALFYLVDKSLFLGWEVKSGPHRPLRHGCLYGPIIKGPLQNIFMGDMGRINREVIIHI